MGGQPMIGEPDKEADPLPLDERAHRALDESRKAIEDSKQAIEQSRKLLKRLKQAAGRPLIPPQSN
jgi:hypothetical protein